MVEAILLESYLETLVADASKAMVKISKAPDEFRALEILRAGAQGQCEEKLVAAAAAQLGKDPCEVWTALLQQAMNRAASERTRERAKYYKSRRPVKKKALSA